MASSNFVPNESILEEYLIQCEIYGFLALVFSRPPNRELFETISKVEFQNIVLNYFLLSKGRSEFQQHLSEMIELFEQNSENYLKMLMVEFNKLFKVPGKNYLIPYESQYHPQAAPLGTTITSEIKSLYHQAGFALDEGNSELADYIGNELAFATTLLHRLSSSELPEEAQSASLRLLRDILINHLGVWIPSFCQRLQTQSSGAYFKGWGLFLEEFTKTWKKIFKDLTPRII